MNRPSAIWYFLFHMLYLPLWKTHLISKEKYYRVWVEDLSNSMKGIKLDQAKEVFNWISDQYLLPTIKNNVFEKLKWHQKRGDTTILASNSFQDLIQIIAERLKINFAIGTNLEVTGDKFSGKIIPPLPFGREKAKRIKALLKEKNLNINFKESFAYSDSIFDLPMLELVGNSIVVGPDKKLLEIAKNKGWPIL
jgi:HAD superfamily hydrolase (TIGR01490 family)